MLHPRGGVERQHRMRFGTEIAADGVRCRLWTPKHRQIRLNIVGDERRAPMRPVGDGWHGLLVSAARVGSLYQFVLPDGLHVPDPASRFQPMDVHGPSEVIDPGGYPWRMRSGAAGRGMSASSTSCTSARSRQRARFGLPSGGSITSANSASLRSNWGSKGTASANRNMMTADQSLIATTGDCMLEADYTS